MRFRRIKSAWRTLAYVGVVVATSVLLAHLIDAALSGDPLQVGRVLWDGWTRPLVIAISLAAIPMVGAPIALFIVWRWYRANKRFS